VDKDTVKGILAKYSPPLSLSQMDEIAEGILKAEGEEVSRSFGEIMAEAGVLESKPSLEKKKSKSLAVTGRRGRTR